MTLMKTLKNASEYTRQKKDKGKWITVGMTHDSHTELKEMSSWYSLSQSETLRIIMKNAHNEFLITTVEKK